MAQPEGAPRPVSVLRHFLDNSASGGLVLMAAALRRSGIHDPAVDATGVLPLLGGGVPVGEIRATF